MSQLVKAGPNTASYPNANDTDGIKLWMMGAAAAAAALATRNAYSNFQNGPFTSWNMNYQAGRAEEPPPGVPEGFDGLMSSDGLDYELVPSGAPSGPPPVYSKRQVTPSGPIAHPVAPTPGLLIGPVGGQITQKDGTVWMRVS